MKPLIPQIDMKLVLHFYLTTILLGQIKIRNLSEGSKVPVLIFSRAFENSIHEKSNDPMKYKSELMGWNPDVRNGNSFEYSSFLSFHVVSSEIRSREREKTSPSDNFGG